MKLVNRKIRIAKYPVAVAMGDDRVYMYEWGTINGLMRFAMGVQIIGIFNDEPHNGQFVEFIEYMERDAVKREYQLTVSDFFNDRLRDWFIRRGYEQLDGVDVVRYKPKSPLT